MRLKSISLSKLLKSDFIYLVDNVVRIVKQHDVRALRIEESFNMLKLHQPQVQLLARKYSSKHITQKLKELHIHRVEYAGFISTQLNSFSRIKKDVLGEEIHIAQLTTRLHLHELRRDSRSVANIRLEMFLKEVKEDPKVKNAFQAVGLLPYIEEMREVNQNYHEVYDDRIRSYSARQTGVENKQIRKKGESLLRSFFAHINQVVETYPELEKKFEKLIGMLNLTITEHNKSTKTRLTYNKKRAAAKAKTAAEGEPKTHILSVNGKESGLVTIGIKKNKGKSKVSSKKQIQSKKTQKVKRTDPVSEKNGDNPLEGLLNILRLPPGNRGV